MYTCTRCGYTCKQKTHIYNHLYKRLKTCKPLINDIQLTEETKQDILSNNTKSTNKNNKSTKKIIYNTNNSNNNTNNNTYNIFLNLDTIKQMEHHHRAINNVLESIDDLVIKLTEDDRENMMRGNGNYLFTHDDLIDTINEATKVKDVDKFTDCVFIHEKERQNTICYNDRDDNRTTGPEWEVLDHNNSAKCVVEIIQKQFWNHYETYLVRKIENEKLSEIENGKIVEHLRLYYTFIACFDLMPYVHGVRSDSEIL